MAFCLVCLGILAKNMPKHLAGYYLLNSYQIIFGGLTMNNTQDKNNPEETRNLEYYIGHIRYDMTNLIKWLVLAILTGLMVGFISSLFCPCTEICHHLPYTEYLGVSPASGIRSYNCISLSEVWPRGWRHQPGSVYHPLTG